MSPGAPVKSGGTQAAQHISFSSLLRRGLHPAWPCILGSSLSLTWPWNSLYTFCVLIATDALQK